MGDNIISIDNENGFDFNEYPRYKVYVKVIEWKVNHEKHYCCTASMSKFIQASIDGDIFVLEYPLFYTYNTWFTRCSFKVTITNLRTQKSIDVMNSKLATFWESIKSFKLIGNDQ